MRTPLAPNGPVYSAMMPSLMGLPAAAAPAEALPAGLAGVMAAGEPAVDEAGFAGGGDEAGAAPPPQAASSRATGTTKLDSAFMDRPPSFRLECPVKASIVSQR